MSLLLSRYSKYFFTTLLSLSLSIIACTQGQQGPAESPDKVTVGGAGGTEGMGGTEGAGGTEAPVAISPEEACQKPENLENVLCKWVATELSSSGPSSDKIQFAYDNQGRVIQLTEFDSGGSKEDVHNITYDSHGEWVVEVLSSPDPVEPEKFTRKTTKTTMRNPVDGAIASINVVEESLNATQWTLLSTKVTTYSPQSPTHLILTTKDYLGSSTTPAVAQTFDITKDANGRWVAMDQREGGWDNATSTVNPLNDWSMHSYEYWPSGRLKKWEKREQNCGTVTCNTQGTHSPTKIETWGILEGPEHATALFRTEDGDYSMPPDNVIDSTYECEAKYELQPQGEIAGLHPFDIMIKHLDEESVEMGFTERDTFTSLVCRASMTGQTAQQQTISIKWVRLWEALPDGKPPGVP